MVFNDLFDDLSVCFIFGITDVFVMPSASGQWIFFRNEYDISTCKGKTEHCNLVSV